MPHPELLLKPMLTTSASGSLEREPFSFLSSDVLL